MFQRQELKDYAEKFNAFDENANGFIDFFELKSMSLFSLLSSFFTSFIFLSSLFFSLFNDDM